MSSSPQHGETNTELIVTSEAGDHTLEGDRNSGRYVSDQGLVYVTLAHTQSIKKSPRKVSIKKEVESVEYVTIDYVRTGLQQDEDLDKEEKSQVKGSGDMEMVDISNTAGNEDSFDANKSLESCQVDNKDDAKLLG
ncbi:unnamed protein product [Lymnaea stagnalis]|uniref:Uncharacterized protein n=1 Tax=Lymnaea stagnalis TaxID=6523 RepID=A0AAV2ICI1_LYMST